MRHVLEGVKGNKSRAAKILEQMPPDLATQIIERFKNLKRSTPTPRPAAKS